MSKRVADITFREIHLRYSNEYFYNFINTLLIKLVLSKFKMTQLTMSEFDNIKVYMKFQCGIGSERIKCRHWPIMT